MQLFKRYLDKADATGASSDPSAGKPGTGTGASSDPSASAGKPGTGTSAGKAKRPQKTPREIELEKDNAELEDENDNLRGRLTALEKFAASAGKQRQPEDPPAPAGSSWDQWIKKGCPIV